MNTSRWRRRRKTLYKRQGGRCCWCGGAMRLGSQIGKMRVDQVTIEHLDSRLSAHRDSTRGEEERTALACYVCNQICNVVDQEFVPGSKRRRLHPSQYADYAAHA